MEWKRLFSKACATVSTINTRYENGCAKLERKIANGSTLDEKTQTVFIPAVKQYAVVCAKHTCTVIDNLPATTVVGAIRQGAGYIVMLSERVTTVVKDKVSCTTTSPEEEDKVPGLIKL